MRINMNKKGFEFSFTWIFAIIVGAAILFMAIYAVTQLMKSGAEQSDVKLGQEIGSSLLNPLEIGYESGKITSFSVPVETRIYNKCDLNGNFGTQKIDISQKTFDKWSIPSGEGEFYNKYIFSDKIINGTNFWLFSQPFAPLFKVNDYIYIIPEKTQYCFADAPEEISEFIMQVNKSFMAIDNCKSNAINICFNDRNCDVFVDMNHKTITKKEGTIKFIGDEEDNGMIFAGIFSEPEIYECQIGRMMKRFNLLSNIYNEKAQLISGIGCESNVELNSLIQETKNYKNSRDLKEIENILLQIKQDYGYNPVCGLW